MFARSAHFARRFGVLVILGLSPAVALADELRIVRVEEDWELVVGTPDVDSTSPQVTCAISPFSHMDSLYASIEINHQSVPQFVPGGLQLQIWEGEIPMWTHKFPNSAAMQTDAETIRWTMVMELADGKLNFAIENGDSQTWGKFGGQGYLKSSRTSTLNDLNQYHPNVSTSNSGAGYAPNRVTTLRVTEIRAVTSSGTVLTSDTPQIVYGD